MYQLVLADPESGYETLAIHDTAWECVRSWELLCDADRTGDYRVESVEGGFDLWRSTPQVCG